MARILVIDDDAVLRGALRHLFTQGGYEVIEAADGYDGLRSIVACPPDVLLLDILLPDLNGIQIIRIVRRSFPHVPIIAMSGGSLYRGRDVLLAARDFGARATFTKPFAPEALLATLQAVIGS
jgi:DNA-binding response OmpR family regulator